MVPDKGASGYLVKVVADFMSGCGCGRATLKSDGEPATLALQEAVKNSRHLKTRRKKTVIHVEDDCRGKVEASDRQQACATSVARECTQERSSRGTKRFMMARQRIRGSRTRDQATRCYRLERRSFG